MTQITNFDFNDTLVRVVDRDGAPWFIAKDICAVLDIANTSQAVANLDDDEKGICNTYTLGGTQRVSAVSESGLYALIFQSRKPEAKAFRKWVTATVLPAIRKDGLYAAGEEHATTEEDLEELTLRVMDGLRQKLAAKERALAAAQPLADAFTRNMTMTDGIGLQDYARSKGLGPNKFPKWLQIEGYISKKKRGAKTIYAPYARKNAGGLFETIHHQHGQLVRITAAGVLHFDRLHDAGELDQIRV